MMRAVLAIVLLSSLPALADNKKKPVTDDRQKGIEVDARGNKSKSYQFTGLDIDGKLKTPQLLYFLNRMKSEFDATTPDKRSFVRELQESPSEM